MSYERTYTVTDVEFKVVFDATPVIPAQLSGPPENCYPAEGGDIDILEIFIGDIEVSNVIAPRIEESLREQISEDLTEITEVDQERPDYCNDDE